MKDNKVSFSIAPTQSQPIQRNQYDSGIGMSVDELNPIEDDVAQDS